MMSVTHTHTVVVEFYIVTRRLSSETNSSRRQTSRVRVKPTNNLFY